jgi:DNA-binding response OmpR family regulator
LLALDDEESMTPVIRALGERAGFEVVVAVTAEPFKTALALHDPDVIMLDLHMPDTDGVEIMRFLANQKSRAAIVILSGLDVRTISSAAHYGRRNGLNVVGTLQKPFVPEDLLNVLRSAKDATPPLACDELRHIAIRCTARTPIEIGEPRP